MENGLTKLAVLAAEPSVLPAEPPVASVELDYDTHLSMVVRQFEESEDATRFARERAEQCRDYYDGKQLTAAELAVYRKRNQPPVIANYVKRKVDFLLGVERRIRSDPKAFPRNPQDEMTSEAATDALRFLADQNDMDSVRSAAFENMVIEGFGAGEVGVEQDAAGNPRITIRHVPWDRIYYDPHSRMPDFSDRRYDGTVVWMDADEAREMWPDSVNAIENTISSASITETYDDRPQNLVWCDNRRKRVRICQAHYRSGGEWYIGTFTKGGWLQMPVISPYLNKDGNTCSPLVMRSLYIDRENNRYGMVRDMISLQDELNKRRSKALHLLNTRQSYGNKQAVLDPQKARQELAKPDGYLEINADAKFGQDFGIIPTSDMAMGQMALLEHVTGELQAQGPNAAQAGKDPRTQSGRAIQAQQQGGAIEQEAMNDALKQWTRDMYEVAWMAVRQYWTEEKWVRVTDDERKMKFVGLNQAFTYAQALEEMPPEQRAQVMQYYGFVPNDPRLNEIAEMRNVISDLDVDIVIEEGPDISSLQGEQFETLANLAQAGLPIPPKAIIQASSLRNKDQILDEMEEGKQLPPAVQKQMADMQQALQEAQQRAAQLEQQVADRAMEFQLKQGELQIKAGELEIKRMTAMKPDAQQPVDPIEQELDARKKIAEIDQTYADTEQTQVETAIMLSQPAVPPMDGSINI